MLHELTKKKKVKSFSVSPENFTGEKGKGGMASEGCGAEAARELGVGWKISPCVSISPNSVFTMADIKGMGAIKHIWMTDNSQNARQLILRIYWDGSETPSVEVPMGDFFATAKNTEFRQISSLAVCVNPGRGLNSYWEMPYRKGFRMTIENISPAPIILYYQIDCESREVSDDELYFHTQFRRSNPLPYMKDHVILDNITGNGKYVGTYIYWGVHNNGWWGEGEVKFFIDGDSDYPTVCGTGTEDYFCGAYNFDVNGNYTEFSTPYSGLSKVDCTDSIYRSNRRFNMYRWHIQDPVYFESDIKVTIQALGWRSEGRYLPLMDDISSVAFWYSDNLNDVFPKFPSRNELEII